MKISIIATISMVLLLVVSYLYNNNPYPVFDDIEHYSWLEHAKQELFGSKQSADNCLYINVAYDKKLIQLNDENDMPLGNVDITDRGKLSKLLSILKGADYNYIFLDVRFEKGYDDNDIYDESGTETIDQHLYSQICHMPRLIVADHRNIQIAADSIRHKTALSEYLSTITATNFVRYEYSHQGQESVPQHIYTKITGNKIEQFGPFKFDNGRLCYNCPFFQIPCQFADNDGDNIPFYNLGSDILDEEAGGIGSEIKALVSGKYIIIGNLTEDVHDTYIGPQPGCYITSVAMNYMLEGKHLVNWVSVLCMGIVYFLITFFMFIRGSVINMIPYLRRTVSRMLRFLLSLLGIGFFMHIVADLIYLIDGETFCLWLPTLYFTVLRTIITYKDI